MPGLENAVGVDAVIAMEQHIVGAPPEVFAGLWGLAGSVLAASDYSALGVRLGIA